MVVIPDSPNGEEVMAPASRAEWRAWLQANHERDMGVWLAIPKKNSRYQTTPYEDLVEEALCFGWIDGISKKGDENFQLLRFTPRRKGSVWAKSNKVRVERMIAAGLMTEAGMAVIEAAKADGSWSQYDDADALIIHDDLAEALDASPEAKAVFERLAPSHKKAHLWHIYSAKRPEIRANRIEATIRSLVEDA
ncbi:MAG TPA: YdeI/OmpD-associated family protein [Acidimicrobiia bacterium]